MNTPDVDNIIVRGARVHNLKNVDVEIPLHKIVGIAGVLGSGKSSLALNIEPLDKASDNYEQRVRRARFYQRNGLADSGYTFLFGECSLLIYSTGESGAAESLKKLFDKAFRYAPGSVRIFKKQQVER